MQGQGKSVEMRCAVSVPLKPSSLITTMDLSSQMITNEKNTFFFSWPYSVAFSAPKAWFSLGGAALGGAGCSLGGVRLAVLPWQCQWAWINWSQPRAHWLQPATAAPAGLSALSCAGDSGRAQGTSPLPSMAPCVPAGILIHPIPWGCLQDSTPRRCLWDPWGVWGVWRGQSCHMDQSPCLGCWFIVTLSPLGASGAPHPHGSSVWVLNLPCSVLPSLLPPSHSP